MNRVLDDVALGGKRRCDVQHRVGEHERARVPGHVDEERVGQPALAAEPGLRRGHGSHEVIGIKAALDERADLAALRQCHRALCCRKGFIRRIDDVDSGKVEPCERRGVADTFFRSDQHRRQVTRKSARQRDLQRIAIAGVHHRCR